VVVDTGTGEVLDSEGVLNLYAVNLMLAVDSEGVVHTAGNAINPGDPLSITTDSGLTYGTILLARVDFKRTDEFVPFCIVNSASQASRRLFGRLLLSAAPGEIVSISGIGLGPKPKLLLGARELQVLTSDSDHVTAIVPNDMANGNSTITIERGTYRVSYPVEVAQVFPGVYTADGLHAAALNEDGSTNSEQNPARRGSIIALFATGLGPLTDDGHIATEFQVVIQPIRASAYAWSRMDVVYAGPAPGLPPGVYQVNVRIPTDAESGEPAINLIFAPPWFERLPNNIRVLVQP
jgi:uncharacterized protein (TIGR03437 family)